MSSSQVHSSATLASRVFQLRHACQRCRDGREHRREDLGGAVACVVMRRDDWDHKSKPKMDGSEMGLSTNGVYQKWLFYKFHKGKSNENMDDDLQMEGFQDV